MVNYLYLKENLDLVSFDSQCLYGDDNDDLIGETKVSSATECKLQCEKTNGCTAFSYSKYNKYKNCNQYRGGPFTSGNRIFGWICYVMPGIFSLFLTFVGHNPVIYTINVYHLREYIIRQLG